MTLAFPRFMVNGGESWACYDLWFPLLFCWMRLLYKMALWRQAGHLPPGFGKIRLATSLQVWQDQAGLPLTVTGTNLPTLSFACVNSARRNWVIIEYPATGLFRPARYQEFCNYFVDSRVFHDILILHRKFTSSGYWSHAPCMMGDFLAPHTQLLTLCNRSYCLG